MQRRAGAVEAYLDEVFQWVKREILDHYNGRVPENELGGTVSVVCKKRFYTLSKSEMEKLEQRARSTGLVVSEVQTAQAKLKADIAERREMLRLFRRSGAVKRETIIELQREIGLLKKSQRQSKV